MKKLVLGSLIVFAAGLRPGLASEARTLPPAVYDQMKGSRNLTKLWVSPTFQAARGFRFGKADSAVVSPYVGDVVKYMPLALGRMAKPESPNVLTMTVTRLDTKEKPVTGYMATTVTVEGQVVDPEGNLLVAFQTRNEANTAGSLQDDGKDAIDLIVGSLAKDLGMPILPKFVKAPKEVANVVVPKPAAPQAAALQPGTPQAAAPAVDASTPAAPQAGAGQPAQPQAGAGQSAPPAANPPEAAPAEQEPDGYVPPFDWNKHQHH